MDNEGGQIDKKNFSRPKSNNWYERQVRDGVEFDITDLNVKDFLHKILWKGPFLVAMAALTSYQLGSGIISEISKSLSDNETKNQPIVAKSKIQLDLQARLESLMLGNGENPHPLVVTEKSSVNNNHKSSH